jgi:hypothetical protein
MLKWILIILLLFGCSTTELELPTGYRLLCSPEGMYTLYIPPRSINDVYKKSFYGGLGTGVWKSEKKAIKYAIHFDEYLKEEPEGYESDKYTWGECKIK